MVHYLSPQVILLVFVYGIDANKQGKMIRKDRG
jgi:hypothetical protein